MNNDARDSIETHGDIHSGVVVLTVAQLPFKQLGGGSNPSGPTCQNRGGISTVLNERHEARAVRAVVL